MEIEEPPVKEKILKVKNFWKRWQTEKEIKVATGPPPTFDELPPKEPPEIQDQAIKEAQLKAGVGTFVSRTAAGMNKTKEEAEKVGEEVAKRQVGGSSSESSETSES